MTHHLHLGRNCIRNFFASLPLALSALAASASDSHTPLSPLYDGSMTPYDISLSQPLSEAVPDSLTPIFINYIGRHGARFLSSEKKIGKLRAVLDEAREKGYLTADGRDFMALLDDVERATASRWGALDSIGVDEESRLASRLYSLFPHLLKKGEVRAEATYVPRVVMSMYTFCHRLDQESSGLDIFTSEGPVNNSFLRFFDVDTPYVEFLDSGAWTSVYDKFVKENVSPHPAINLVSDLYGLDTRKMRNLTLDIYGVLQSLRAAGLPAPTTRWMSEEEYRDCWRAANLNHFLRRTPSGLSPIPGRAAAPLLDSFIEYGDSAAAGVTNPKAILRFAHAETLMPLFALMHIQDCYSPSTDYMHIYAEWKDYDVVPLGANLIVVSLRAPSGRIYAAMNLNGRWTAPVGDGRFVVGWDELRAYWLSNLRLLQ